jgi:hypothetical protein
MLSHCDSPAWDFRTSVSPANRATRRTSKKLRYMFGPPPQGFRTSPIDGTKVLTCYQQLTAECCNARTSSSGRSYRSQASCLYAHNGFFKVLWVGSGSTGHLLVLFWLLGMILPRQPMPSARQDVLGEALPEKTIVRDLSSGNVQEGRRPGDAARFSANGERVGRYPP